MPYMNKSLVYMLFLCVVANMLSCHEEGDTPILNDLSELTDQNPIISVLNWRVSGPFRDTTIVRGILSSSTPLDTFSNDILGADMIDTILHHRRGMYLDFELLFDATDKYNAYAFSVIRCKSRVETAFLIGVDDNVRLWVNGKLLFETTGGRGLTKNPFIKKIELDKGDNVVIAEVSNHGGQCKFSLDVATVDYVRSNALVDNYYNTIVNPIMDISDSLHLKISNPEFIPVTKPCTLIVLDINKHKVRTKIFSVEDEVKISLDSLGEGIYSYDLFTDIDTLNGLFFRGVIENVYKKDSLQATFHSDPELTRLIQPYFKRMDRLLGDALRGLHHDLAKKITICLYKICEIENVAKKDRKKVMSLDGWQIRSFVSAIDHSDDHYLLYVPKSQRVISSADMPLVVVVPYITGNHPFYTGGVVTNTHRVEYISKFAEQYGMAVVWPSSRVYSRLNLTPIVGKSIREAISDVGKYYHIDEENIFYYGDCSGAYLGLMAAVHNPDGVKALALEGPDLTPIKFEILRNNEQPLTSQNILEFKKNIQDKSILFLHSKNDHIAPQILSLRLMDSLKNSGIEISFDDLGDGLKIRGRKLISEQESMKKVFAFFHKQTRYEKRADKKQYQSYGMYKDFIYGISIDKKFGVGKCGFEYTLSKNILNININNVAELTLDTSLLNQKGIKDGTAKIHINGKLLSESELIRSDDFWKIKILSDDLNSAVIKYASRKPINAVFSGPFFIVDDSMDNEIKKSAVDLIDSIWQVEYLVKPKNISDASTINNGNVVRIEVDSTLLDLREILDNHPTINSWIANRRKECSLSYAKLKESNLGRIELIIGSNGGEIPSRFIEYIIQHGWQNTVLWDNCAENIMYEEYPL